MNYCTDSWKKSGGRVRVIELPGGYRTQHELRQNHQRLCRTADSAVLAIARSTDPFLRHAKAAALNQLPCSFSMSFQRRLSGISNATASCCAMPILIWTLPSSIELT